MTPGLVGIAVLGSVVLGLLAGIWLALVLTTHNLALAERCDRVLTLQDGRVVEKG